MKGNAHSIKGLVTVTRAIIRIDGPDIQILSDRGVETSQGSTVVCWTITQPPCSAMSFHGDSWNSFRVTLLDSSTGLKGAGKGKEAVLDP